MPCWLCVQWWGLHAPRPLWLPWQRHVLPLGARELSSRCVSCARIRRLGDHLAASSRLVEMGPCVCCVRGSGYGVLSGSNQVSGDPHHHTFNGVIFTSQGARHYVPSCACQVGQGAPAFTVWVDNDYLSPTASLTGAWQIEVGAQEVKVMMEAQTTGKIQISSARARTRVQGAPHPGLGGLKGHGPCQGS